MQITLPGPFEMQWVPRRIVLHWTAGAGQASQNDKKHYHLLVEQDGTLVAGEPSIASNCRSLSGAHGWSHDHPDGYAPHTRGFNSYSIGVSLCGMMGATEGPPIMPGAHPLSVSQTDALIPLLAMICKLYGLWPTSHTIVTHEEVQRLHGVKQRGKWDITWLPTNEGVIEGNAVGPWIRQRVAAQMMHAA